LPHSGVAVKSLLVDRDADEHSKHDHDDRTMVRVLDKQHLASGSSFRADGKGSGGGA
jgi:hypothetical protein